MKKECATKPSGRWNFLQLLSNMNQQSITTRPLKLLVVGDSLTNSTSKGPSNPFYCDLSNENAVESNYASVIGSIGPTKQQKIAWIFVTNGLQEYLYSANSVTPNYIFIPISVEDGITSRTKELIGIALTLRIPIILLLSKTELTKESEHAATLKAVEVMVTKWMKKEMISLSAGASAISMERIVKKMNEGAAIPVITIMVGSKIQSLKHLISSLELNDKESNEKALCEVWVSRTWTIADSKIGCEGIVKTGKLEVNKYLRFGPLDSQFYTIVVKKISTYEDNVQSAKAGNRVMFEAILVEGKKLGTEEQTMVAVEKVDKGKLAEEFDAEIAVLTEIPIKAGQTTTLFTGNICKTIKIEDTELLQGDRGIVRCKLNGSELINAGTKIFFVNDAIIAIGVITKTYK